jgi:hypothetical protein
VRTLGLLAFGTAVVSAVLAVSYFLSPLAYLAAAVAVPLGLLGRGHRRSRALGTAAVVVSTVAVVVATVVLLVLP